MFQIKSLLRYFVALSALYLFTGTVSFADHLSALDLNGRYAEITQTSHEQALTKNLNSHQRYFYTVDEITIPMVLLSNCVIDQATFEECWNGGASEFWDNCLSRQQERGIVGYTWTLIFCYGMQKSLLVDILKHELQLLKIAENGWIDDTVDLQQTSWETYLDTMCQLEQSLLAEGNSAYKFWCEREGYINRIIEIEQLRTKAVQQ